MPDHALVSSLKEHGGSHCSQDDHSVNLESLKIFCAVAEERSITRAAARLGRVPSNVTTRVQRLEMDFGVELFARTGKRMNLSTAGECLLGYAHRLLALDDEAKHVVAESRYGGGLRIGGVESAAATRLPSVLGTYHACHPSTRLDFYTGTSRQLIEQVRKGLLDCAFLALPASIERKSTLKGMGLAAEVVWREELLWLLPESESDVRRTEDIRVRRLAALAPGCAYRALAEEWLGIAVLTEWKVVEVISYFAMPAYVAAGECVALLPSGVLDVLGTLPKLKTLRGRAVNTYLLWHQDYDAPAFRNLLRLLKEF